MRVHHWFRHLSSPQADRFASVWDAIADTPEEAANLRLRSELMDKISELIATSGWTQSEAAARCGLTQPPYTPIALNGLAHFEVEEESGIYRIRAVEIR